MAIDDAASIIERAKENPTQTVLLIIAALGIVVLIAAAKKVGEKIGTGTRPVRGIAFVAAVLVAIVAISAVTSSSDDGECAGLTDAECAALKEALETEGTN